MHKARADYDAIDRALKPHQRDTLREYAKTQGCDPDAWQQNTTCCVVALALAVENTVARYIADGVDERRALLRAAAELDIDLDTIRRRRRRQLQQHKAAEL